MAEPGLVRLQMDGEMPSGGENGVMLIRVFELSNTAEISRDRVAQFLARRGDLPLCSTPCSRRRKIESLDARAFVASQAKRVAEFACRVRAVIVLNNQGMDESCDPLEDCVLQTGMLGDASRAVPCDPANGVLALGPTLFFFGASFRAYPTSFFHGYRCMGYRDEFIFWLAPLLSAR
jgi:hypothetical protein